MGKVKNKKRSFAENVNKDHDRKNKKIMNPFEVHINKEKLRVLGKKLCNDQGLPGISRVKALKKRKRTLLPEYNIQHKTNNFMDKRIGEHNKGFSIEDKTMVRYTAVRVKQHKKTSIFNLADDEILTHHGQTLSEIEKFDTPLSDDDDDSVDGERKTGHLERKFVEDAHFGGGMLKKPSVVRSHKDLIDQLIVESKKRKAEKQKLKEATLDLTEKLDTEWKDLLPIVSKSRKEQDHNKPETIDEYDKMMRQLKFEARGIPSNKLKTEDEIANEEKEKLEKLETERLKRMRGTLINQNAVKNHRSADDLNDNFDYNSDTPDITLSYNDEGTSNIKVQIQPEEKIDETDEEELESDNDTDNDSLSDLKESDVSDEESYDHNNDGDNNTNIENSEAVEIKPTAIKDTNKIKAIELEKYAEIKMDLLKRKDIMEEASLELPYTYSLPENYQSLKDTLQNHNSYNHGVIISRIIKCNHPSLNEGNKQALGTLFVYLLQYMNDICAGAKDKKSINECFKIFSSITPQLFDLAQFDQENAHTSLLEVIKEKQTTFRNSCRKFPPIDVLLYIKLVSCLFSTSDFRNQVVTPCIVFMEQMLTKCRVTTRKDIAYGLFIVCLIAEFTSLSKRYSPAAIRYLSGILHMAIPKTGVQLIKVLPPFKHTNTHLVLNSSLVSAEEYKLGASDLLHKCDIDDIFRIGVVNVTTGLLINFYKNLSLLSSCLEIFQLSLYYINMIPLVNYPGMIVSQINEFKQLIQDYKSNQKLEYILMDKKRPKALRLYEPNVVRVYDRKTHKVQSKEKVERDKLLHKLKKEQKGAIREIRRDSTFLGRVKINLKLRSDADRKQKVKQIFSDAAIQQSEINLIDRKNKSKNK